MKVLIVNRFFGGAQIPTGRMAEDVARVLVAEGHEVTALASSGAYEGAAQAGDTGEAGVAVGQCCGEAVGTEQLKNRTTEILTHRSALRVETVHVPKWMPRALAWVWFTWQARKRIPRMEWDVCVLMTDPPLLPLLARRAARRRDKETKRPKDEEPKNRTEGRTAVDSPKANTEIPPHRATRRVAVWLMDLYPEALAASGRLSEGNPLYRWYFERRQKALAAADLLICLGHAQKELLGAGARQSGVSVGPCFSESVKTELPNYRTTEPLRPPLALGPRTVVVPPWDDRGNIALATEESLRNLALYAGNLGEAHCFEEILAAAPYLPGDWKVRFAVRGAKFAGLKAAANELKRPRDQETKRPGVEVEVTGYASEVETPGLLASARVHLLTMSPGWEGIVVPSKLYGCVRTGRPVLFIGPENADTAREILANDWGAVLPPGASGERVAAVILELAARPTKLPAVQRGAVEVARQLQFLATD